MPPLRPGESPLDVGAALQEGWTAFRRAPWVLTGFTLLVVALSMALALIETAIAPAVGDLPATPTPGLLLCRLASVALSLWAVVGLVRGSWIALQGRRPLFVELLRWDGPAIGRVLLASLLLGLILGLILLPLCVLLVGSLDQMVDFDFPLSGPPVQRSFTPTPVSLLLFTLSLLGLMGVLLYAQVNQHFLVQLASLRGTGALRTLTEGRAVVDRQWWPVLGLLALESLLLLAGAMALLVGLFVALPVVVCVSTAAYRQLFGDADPAGALPRA